MREAEYKRVRKEMEAELSSAEEALSKVQAKIAALDLLWNTHFSAKSSEKTSCNVDSTSLEPQRAVVVNGQAQQLIDEAAGQLEGETFGVKDIQRIIHAFHPDMTVNRTTIAGRLRNLVDEKKLDLVEQGVGRKPGKFKGRSAA